MLSYQWNGNLALNVSGFQKVHPCYVHNTHSFTNSVFKIVSFQTLCISSSDKSIFMVYLLLHWYKSIFSSFILSAYKYRKTDQKRLLQRLCPHHCQMKPSLCSYLNLKEGQHIIFVCVNSAYRLEEFVNTIIKPHISTYKTQTLTRERVGSINQNNLKNKCKLNNVT